MKRQFISLLLAQALFACGLAALEISTKTDEDFPKIKLVGFARLRYTVDWTPGKADGFSLSQARIGITGAISRDFSYTLMLEPTNADTENSKMVLDAYVDTTLVRNFRLRAGQFKYGFGLEQTTPDADLELVNKSDVVSSLIKPSRDIGLQAARDFSLGKIASTLTVAVINGSGSNVEDENNRKALVGRLLVAPLRGLALGGSYYTGTAGAANDRKERAGLELKYEWQRLLLKAEYIRGKDKDVEKEGYYITVGYCLLPAMVALVRYDRWNADCHACGKKASRWTVGVNHYFGRNVLLRTNYERRMETPALKNDVLVIQFQVKF